MSGELGHASLDLTADTTGLDEGRVAVGRMDDSLDALAAVAKIAEDALANVKMSDRQATESGISAEGILSGVRGISDDARTAAIALDRVKLTAAQAAESDIAGDSIDRKLDDIKRNAEETRLALDRVKLKDGGRDGVGVGPVGSGYGRLGVLGTAVGAGVLTAPAAGPAIGGLLAAIPSLAAGGIGALGTLALAFDGVTKAIGGDKKAFDSLSPAAQQFTLTIRSLDGWFDKLRQTAGSNLFPGLTAGLKSALSPGTVAAITKAVAEFGQAIGQAGAQLGQYFGSSEFGSIFGPLMASAAKNLKTVSGAALSLFDALGVLGRAAIPLTSWMTQGIANGAKLADNWLHAKDATGQLGDAMNEAKSSLQLVGNLLGSLFNAVEALGVALYPVSKVAVKDLTDGLNALAGMIERNQTGIRNIVGGALSAFVSTVKAATPIVRTLAQVLSTVVHAIGGWKTAFEGLFLLGIAVKLNAIGLKVISIGTAWKAAALKMTAATGVVEGDTAAIGTAATVAEGETLGLRGALLSLGDPVVLGAIAAAAAGYAGFKLGEKLRGSPNNGGYGTPAANAAAKAHPGQWVNAQGQPVNPETGKVINPNLVTTPFHPNLKLPSSLSDAINAAYAGHGNLAKANAAAYAYYENLLQAAGLSMKDKQSIYSAEEPYTPPPKASNVFGTPPPFTKNLGTTKGLTSAQRTSLESKLTGIDNKIVKATPLFTAEGPQFYSAAYAHNAPFAKKSSSNYQTKLTPQQEIAFRAWVKKNHVPFDVNAKIVDYDMRGYWLAMQDGTVPKWAGGQAHFTDTFKTPYDTTFSNESKYATSNNPFVWKGNNLVDKRNGQLVFGSSPDAASLRKQAAAIRAKLGGTTGGVSLIPSVLSDAATRYASIAKSLGDTGAKAEQYLNSEQSTLQQEVAFLKGSLGGASAKMKAAIESAITTVQTKMRTVRTQLSKSIADDRAAELQFAVDQAKDAVASATVGSTAYKKAVTAEEKALRDQIAYLDARAKNSKLSLAARTKAITEETADKKALSALLKPLKAAGDANEAQFLADYAAIAENYAPNATPVSAGVTDTHLYAIKHELRQQTPLLRAGLKKAKFPSSGFAHSTPSAVTG